jgi:inorganic pyrophosphatase
VLCCVLCCVAGPSLNILIKLMAVESLVFAPYFANIAGGEGLIFQFFSGN